MAALSTIEPAAGPRTGKALAAHAWNGACPGCGAASAARVDGPTHAYLGASSACWELYQRLARPLGTERESGRIRRLVEDAYAAQHPGVPQRRSIQSVAIHLMDLCLLLEREGEIHRLVAVDGRMPRRRPLDLHWLEPPAVRGRTTIGQALAADGGGDRATRVEAWARQVWRAWEPHHPTIRRWLDASRGGPAG